MATQEFYVRNEFDTEARGPFVLEQLLTLAENGQIKAETLYYEATSEQWMPIGGNLALMAALFPEKKKLNVRPKEGIKSLNEQKDTNPPLTVEDMLAAAEGRTEETKDQMRPDEALARAAGFGMYTCILLLVLSAAALCLPSIDAITELNTEKLLRTPLVFLGVLDLLLALLLLLQMVTLYPFIRFRAAFGAGLLGFQLFIGGYSTACLAVVAGSLGLYLCTLATSISNWAMAAAIGLAGMLGFAYFSLV